MKRILVAAGDRRLTRFVAESLLGRTIDRDNPGLTSPEWDISRAHTALETRLIITDSGRVFDAVVIDQNLPGDELLATLAELRTWPETQDVPLFVMSERGRDQLSRKLASDRYSISGFIDKPVSSSGLRASLEDLHRQRLILIVDSDQKRAAASQEALIDAGYETEVVRTGALARARLNDNSAQTDAVIVSIKLRDMSGADLCVDIKQAQTLRPTPVLLVGAVEDLACVQINENAHRADDFLRTPFIGEELVRRIAPLVGRSVRDPSRPSYAFNELPQTRTDQPAPDVFDEPRVINTSITALSDLEDDGRSKTGETDAPPELAEEETLDGESENTDVVRQNLRKVDPPAPVSPTTHSKRATRRVPCQVHVKIQEGETIYESETLNISNGGILITTDHPLLVGTKIDLNFSLPKSAEPITAVGKVVWISDADANESDHRSAVGVKFSRIDPEQLELIVRYVNQVANVVYVAP